MSLVHDALLKAAREKNRQAVPSVAPAPAEPERIPAAPSPRREPARPSPAPGLSESRPNSPAPAAAKPASALWSVAVACVAVVGIVAIVYLVSRVIPVRTEPAAASPTAPSRAGIDPSPPPAPATGEAEPPAASASAPSSAPSPEAVETDATGGYHLTGIMKDPEGKFCAVINGRMMYEQQFVDGAIVQRIERDRVTLTVRGHAQVLRLY